MTSGILVLILGEQLNSAIAEGDSLKMLFVFQLLEHQNQIQPSYIPCFLVYGLQYKYIKKFSFITLIAWFRLIQLLYG